MQELNNLFPTVLIFFIRELMYLSAIDTSLYRLFNPIPFTTYLIYKKDYPIKMSEYLYLYLSVCMYNETWIVEFSVLFTREGVDTGRLINQHSTSFCCHSNIGHVTS